MKKVIFVLISILYFLFFCLIFVSNIGNTTFDKSDFFCFNVKILLPEQWNFFTKNPKADKITFYIKSSDGKYVHSTAFPNSSTDNYWGIKRKSRAASAEFGHLNKEYLTIDQWNKFTGGSSILSYASIDSFRVYTIKNSFLNPQLCGEYLIAVQEPLPWAWATHEFQDNMPGQFVKIFFDCNERK